MDLNVDRICTIRKNLRDLYITMSLIIFVLLCGTLVGIDASDRKCNLIRNDYKSSLAYVCIEADISNLEELPGNVEWIEFSVSRFPSIPADTFGRFSRLRKLTFYNCDIRDTDPAAFRGLNNLELLVLYNSKIGVIHAASFRHLPNLRRLVLERNRLVYVMPDAFSGLTNVRNLNLYDNDLNCLPIDLLSDLPRLKNVQIGRNPWLCSCRKDLELFFEKKGIHIEYEERSSNECMTEVKLAKTQGTFFPVNKAEPGTILTSSGDVGNSLSFLSKLQDDIRWISVTAINIKKIPAYIFFRFGNSLRSLEFRDCNITEIDVGAFAGLAKLKRLTLVGNYLNFIKANLFHDLVNLKTLILDANHIVEIENRVFSSLGKLRDLSLDNNKLQCLPTHELHNLVQLKRLNLISNPWNCTCQAVLKNYLVRNGIGYEINDFRCNSRQLETNDIKESGKIDKRQVYEVYEETQKNTTTILKMGSVTKTTTEVQTERESPVVEYYDEILLGKNCCTPCRKVDIPGFKLAYSCHKTTLDRTNDIPSTIDALVFSASRLSTITRSSLMRFWQSLKMLKLWNCQTRIIEPDAFVDLVALETLIIYNDNLKIVRASWFQRLHNLKHLTLTGNKISKIEDGVFPHLSNLETLEIDDNQMTCISLDLLDSLQHLKFIRIAGNPWTCSCRLRLVQFLEERQISYERNMFEDDIRADESKCLSTTTAAAPTVKTTSQSPDCNRTTGVASNHCATVSSKAQCTHEMGVEPGRIIKYKCNYGNLSVIDEISSNAESIELDEVCIHYLPPRAFSKFHNLTKLVIRNCSLHEVDPRALDGLFRLQELSIHKNRLVTIDSSWFRDTTRLRNLSLTQNSLTEISVDTFTNLVGSLEYLSLQGNNLTCIYTAMLANLRRLKSLEFGGNKLKWRCWAELLDYLQLRDVSYTKMPNPRNSETFLWDFFQEKPEERKSSRANVTGILEFLAIGLIFLVRCF